MGSFTPRALMQLAESQSISPLAFRLYAILDNLQHARGEKPVFYPRKGFAEKVGCGVHQAIGAFKELEKLGLITPEKTGGVSISYMVTKLDRVLFLDDGNFEISNADGANSAPSMVPIQHHNGANSAPSMVPIQHHNGANSAPSAYLINKEINEISEREKINARETREELSPSLQTQNDFRYPTTPEEVIQAAEAQCIKLTEQDALIFLDNYRSKGWMVGGSRITDWKARIRLFAEARKQLNHQNKGVSQNDNANTIRGGHVVGHESDFASDPIFGKHAGS